MKFNSRICTTKEQSLIENGFDVIEFVPSYDEDGGLITCGNAILSGTKVKVPHKDEIYYSII